MDCRPPGSSVHGILQARILEWISIPSPGDLPDPGIKTASAALACCLFVVGPPGKPLIWYSLVLFTQEYIEELPVLRNTLAHKASPDCGLCKRLLRMDQFSLEMVAKKKYWEWQNIILISKTPSHFSIVKCVCVMSCCCSVNPSCLSLCNPWIKGVYSEKRNGQIQRHEIKVKKRNE